MHALLFSILSGLAVQVDDGPPPPPVTGGKGFTMDYGPFFSSSVTGPRDKKGGAILALKGFTIRVGKNRGASVCFDSEDLRWSGAWLGFLDLSKTHMTTAKGGLPPAAGGPLLLKTRPGPGWEGGKGHYRGAYLHGDQVALSYTVGEADILESPGLVTASGLTGFTRTFHLGKSSSAATLVLADLEGSSGSSRKDHAVLEGNAEAMAAGCGKLPSGATWSVSGGRLALKLPARSAATLLHLVLWGGPKAEVDRFPELLKVVADAKNPADLTKGGPARWPQPIQARGRSGADAAAYVVDTLPLPEANPWNSWLRPGGLDFFSDGRLAVSTWNGDVWVLSGIDETLQRLSWRRYATGLYEPLGLRIVDNVGYVLGRDRITRLHDLDQDGEADFYENFNSQSAISPNYHAFAFDLQTDREGNFYYLRDGHRIAPGLRDGLPGRQRDGSGATG